MRKLLLSFLVLPFVVKGQDTTLQHIFPMKGGKVVYERVVDVDSATKDQLYSRAKTWAISNFKSQKDASQTDDRTLGLIAYRGYFSEEFTAPPMMGISGKADWLYWHTLKIYIKDNKVKILVDDIQLGAVGVPQVIAIEGLRDYIESAYKKGLVGKNYREKYIERTYENLRLANAQIETNIESLTNTLKKEKSDFDF